MQLGINWECIWVIWQKSRKGPEMGLGYLRMDAALDEGARARTMAPCARPVAAMLAYEAKASDEMVLVHPWRRSTRTWAQPVPVYAPPQMESTHGWFHVDLQT